MGKKLIFCQQINPKVDGITLGMHSQTGYKYQKQPVYNIFAISQGKHEG